ncbi:hypothetical protein POM88_026844 [Heracleum sosnowskyi]|uniref:Aldehyde dehydrogenase domain-containing protein n=1 Tax=Heracleum sosnowskyi TaxID=360622 RepID=A0AAD8MKZ9_9APIA|nr:hypothetical protein POM88_026844 [Heracleum sosnowskyi]
MHYHFALTADQINLDGISSESSTSSAEPSWKRRYPLRVPNFIGGKFVESQSSTSIDVINPATQEVVSQVPVTTHEEFQPAVFAAKRALLSWRNTPLAAGQRVMFRFQELIQRDIEKIASSITTEQGKTLKDARHDVLRGLEAVGHACVTTSLPMGDFVPNVPSGTDTYSIREPLGIYAGVCPFNFPEMVPLWMFLIAVTCGNTFILKSSERDTDKYVVCGKVVCAITLTPKKSSWLISLIFYKLVMWHSVGQIQEDKLVSRAKALKVSAGIEPDIDIGPVISKQAKEKICRLIQFGVENGARLVLDGRQIRLAGVVAVDFAGGSDVPFHPGRKDLSEPPVEGRLSNATLGHLRGVIRSYLDLKDPRPAFLSSSSSSTTDPVLCLLVEKYGADEDAFFADYAESHMKFSELGETLQWTIPLSQIRGITSGIELSSLDFEAMSLDSRTGTSMDTARDHRLGCTVQVHGHLLTYVLKNHPLHTGLKL